MTVPPQTQWGPVNVTYGNSAEIIVEFYDINGDITVPTGANFVISYINTSNASQTDTVALSLVNQYYIGSWSTSLASHGLATWVVSATGGSTATQTGQIRVTSVP